MVESFADLSVLPDVFLFDSGFVSLLDTAMQDFDNDDQQAPPPQLITVDAVSIKLPHSTSMTQSFGLSL